VEVVELLLVEVVVVEVVVVAVVEKWMFMIGWEICPFLKIKNIP
jgi:hypothetical protein